MDKKLQNFLLVASIAIAVVAGTFLFYKDKNSSLTELAEVEVGEYEGKDLSSIKDFRENSIKGPQYVNRDDYKLKILGLEGGEIDYNYDEIIQSNKSYKKVVTLNCVEGWSVKILWEGFLVRDLIDADKIPDSANTIIFRAYDGYSTSFPIEYIMDGDIIMAYKMNEVELPPERGFPFQLVAQSKYGYKWIKWITEIEFSDDADYKGYWESRGYSNSGDLNKKFIEN